MKSPRSPRVFYGWWIVAACFLLAMYMSGVVFYGFTAIFKPIADEFHWSYVEVSLAASIRGLEGGLLAPLLGLLVDRLGARKIMLTGVVCAALGFFLLSQMQSLSVFYVTAVLMAVGASSVGISIATTVLGHWFRRKLGLAIGIMACGHGAAGLVVPVIVRLIELYDWRIAALILSIIMVVIGIPMALIIRSKPEPYGYLPDGESAHPITDSADAEVFTVEESVSARAAFSSRAFWFLIIALFPQFIAVGAVVAHVMPYLSSVNISLALSSMVATSLPLMSMVGRFGMGRLGDYMNRRLLVTGSLVALAISMLCFEFVSAGAAWLLLIFIPLFSISYGGNIAILGIVLRGHFGMRHFGTIMGFTWGILLVGNVFGPPLAGWFFDNRGSYQYSWLLMAGLVVIGALFMAATPEKKK